MADTLKLLGVVAFVYVAAMVLGYDPMHLAFQAVGGTLNALWTEFVNAVANAINPL